MLKLTIFKTVPSMVKSIVKSPQILTNELLQAESFVRSLLPLFLLNLISGRWAGHRVMWMHFSFSFSFFHFCCCWMWVTLKKTAWVFSAQNNLLIYSLKLTKSRRLNIKSDEGKWCCEVPKHFELLWVETLLKHQQSLLRVLLFYLCIKEVK
jgi:hypothetical protein